MNVLIIPAFACFIVASLAFVSQDDTENSKVRSRQYGHPDCLKVITDVIETSTETEQYQVTQALNDMEQDHSHAYAVFTFDKRYPRHVYKVSNYFARHDRRHIETGCFKVTPNEDKRYLAKTSVIGSFSPVASLGHETRKTMETPTERAEDLCPDENLKGIYDRVLSRYGPVSHIDVILERLVREARRTMGGFWVAQGWQRNYSRLFNQDKFALSGIDRCDRYFKVGRHNPETYISLVRVANSAHVESVDEERVYTFQDMLSE
jgi:hypothetical protein